MSGVEQRYSDISPVTLQVAGGVVTSRLYCKEVEGLSQAESFLVELYRCKLCQFTCGLKATISSHVLLRHDPPDLPCLSGPEGDEVGREGSEPELQRMESPYQLDLNGEAKQGDEDEEFLLYNMLDSMSPASCDMTTEDGLQVAHTCEVTTPCKPYLSVSNTPVLLMVTQRSGKLIRESPFKEGGSLMVPR